MLIRVGLILVLCDGPSVLNGAILEMAHGPLGSGKMYLPCVLDGVEERCVLDTGSVISLVENDDRFSKYPAFGSFHFKSASGISLEADKIQIRRAQIDKQLFQNAAFARPSHDHNIESTIGINLIGQKPFWLHFGERASIELGATAPTSLLGGIETREDGIFSIPIGLGDFKTQAVWDTAAELTAVDKNYVTKNPENFSAMRQQAYAKDGTAQPVESKLFKAKKILVGGRTFRNVTVLAVDLSSLHQDKGEGIHAVIGFNIIRGADWFFDVPNKRWNIKRTVIQQRRR